LTDSARQDSGLISIEQFAQKILVVSNLQPRKLRGFESRGMFLAASADDGRPLLATVPSETPSQAFTWTATPFRGL
jgi:tRNA-binding EMAP/Myf-like protein